MLRNDAERGQIQTNCWITTMLMGGGETTVAAEVQAVVDSKAQGKPPDMPECGSAAYPPAFRLCLFPLRNPTFFIPFPFHSSFSNLPALLSDLLQSVLPIE
jgi:hypothetical protein